MIKERTKRQFIPWLYVALPLGLLGLLTFLPVLNMFRYSVTNWDGVDPTRKYVGMSNYGKVFTDPDIFHTLFVSIYYFGGAIIQIVFALFLATILSYGLRGANFYKSFLVFPFLLNAVAVSLVFRFLFRGGDGLGAGGLDVLLQHLGLGRFVTQWTGNPHIVNYSLAGVSIWRYIGFNIVLFLGAIQSINPELF